MGEEALHPGFEMNITHFKTKPMCVAWNDPDLIKGVMISTPFPFPNHYTFDGVGGIPRRGLRALGEYATFFTK